MTLKQGTEDVARGAVAATAVTERDALPRDYSNCKMLENVQPEDIEDISERFTSIMGTKVEGDTVKRIRLRKPGSEEQELYAVSLIEHKSDVDYDVVMQLLHYISNIWRDYARSRRYQTERGDWVEANKAKAFRYPPILPIVYYEGIDRWTAGMQLRDRVLTVEGLEEYIPNFSYKLVGIRDYGSEELLDKADAVNRIVSKSPEHVLDVILDVVYLLCRKVNLSGDETHEMLSQLKEGRNMGYLFENMEHMDIQEERRKTREAREELEQYRKQADMELTKTQTELANALKELEHYRAAEKERGKA